MFRKPPQRTGFAGKRERGQAIILLAFMMVALMGMLGLAIDGGGLFFLHRDTQNAVDAALVAALYAKCTGNKQVLESQLSDPADPNSPTLFEMSIRSAALTAAASNGFSDGVNAEIDVETNYQPPGTSNDEYIRVQIIANKPAYFIQLVYHEPLSVTTAGVGYCDRSNVGLFPPSAIFSTRNSNATCGNSSNNASISNGGGSSIVVSGGIFSQSNNPTCAIEGQSSASSFVVSGACQAVGGIDSGSLTCASYEPNQEPWFSQNPLNEEDRPSCVAGQNTMSAAELVTVNTLGIATLDGKPFSRGYKPGTYSSLDIGNKDNVYLAPGLYCFPASASGMKITGGYLYGEGVTFYFFPKANGEPAANGIDRTGGNLLLTAPTKGATGNCIQGSGAGATCDFAGLLIWKDTTLDPINSAGDNANQLHLNGNGGRYTPDYYKGMIYAPATDCTFEGNSSATVRGMVVCYSVRGTGGGNQPNNLVVIYELPDFLNTPPRVSITS